MTWSIINIFDNINKEGTTVIIATHNAEVVANLGRRVVALDRGRIVKDKKEEKHASSK